MLTIQSFTNSKVLGEFGSSLTPVQIIALRAYHPALRQYNKVYFSIVGTSQYIVVAASSVRNPLPLSGYQVHFFPHKIHTPPAHVICPEEDLISDTIDPQQPLDPKISSLHPAE
jgi:hypothetical protein